jgi:hypothetical protein
MPKKVKGRSLPLTYSHKLLQKEYKIILLSLNAETHPQTGQKVQKMAKKAKMKVQKP